MPLDRSSQPIVSRGDGQGSHAGSGMTGVPLIDLSSARRGGRRDRQSAAAAVDAACREIGFFAITGH
ncbi:MAG: 2-oxoglutarate and iron-dependent oxygenase domain-containing protein, partial [Candidatus Rokuibacteriota bacterium]